MMELDASLKRLDEEFGPHICYRDAELKDMFLFEKYLPQLYILSEQPWAMCVGALGAKEAAVIRHFHQRNYRIPIENVKVSACNIRDLGELPGIDHYDMIMSGKLHGDAAQDFTWISPFCKEGNERADYDLVNIRNPNICSNTDWSGVFRKGIKYTSPEGALVTLIRQEDAEPFARFIELFKDEYGISPVIYEQTGIECKNPGFNFHHTIAVFKPKE